MALPTVEVETVCPNSSSKASQCSSRVRSSLASSCFGSHSLSIVPLLGGLPGIGLGSTSPVSRRLFSQRFMVGIDTEKVFATSSLGVPASTAASTLNLRSFEYGFIPGGYHIWIDTYGCRCEIPLSRATRLFSCLPLLTEPHPSTRFYQRRLCRGVCGFEPVSQDLVLRVGEPMGSVSLQGRELPYQPGEVAGRVPGYILRVLWSYLRAAEDAPPPGPWLGALPGTFLAG